ncbi:hemerythrin domain-containing protein [Aquamicrobium lusatiense]|uniref:hemerythrin domain-containing protein n=1 Tax=Aquamicrobium TaxID=69278 RepID=UPI0024554919|nr:MULTISPECIES: hemerythrin domain-containing protein [Aquamicrobium]MCK9552430.1 hemerythrin domain-containing protein [Aquamicrobium sp.]MDH4991283.1 hemerythrin domain-containing protein [Aquamicrobium lusatiense]
MKTIRITTLQGGEARQPRCQESMIAIVELAHAQMLRLCGLLEEVADSLPASVDRRKCLMIACELEPLVRGIHRFEEETLLPAYERALEQRGRGRGSLERLLAEHVEDECFAGELSEALLLLGRDGSVDNPEALGFMLRGFFEGQRRHVAFEREHVLPEIGCVEA